jgi:hypothetical protein
LLNAEGWRDLDTTAYLSATGTLPPVIRPVVRRGLQTAPIQHISTQRSAM